MKRYIYKFKGLFFLNIINIFLYAIINVVVALVLQPIIDAGIEMDIEKLKLYSVLAIIIIIIYGLLIFTKQYFQSLFLKNVTLAIKNDVFTNILNKNIRDFKQCNTANYISILTNDISILEDDFFSNLLKLISNIITFISATIILTLINPIITIFIFATGFLPMLTPVILGKRLSQRKKKYSESLGKYTSQIKDMFSGFEIIKSFNIESKSRENYEKVNSICENSKHNFNVISALAEASSECLGSIMFLGIMCLGVYFVIKGNMSVGLMLVTTQLVNSVIYPLKLLSERISKFKSVKAVRESIEMLLVNDNKNEDGINLTEFNNRIIFEDIEFSYNDKRDILKGVNLTIEKGGKYAIVGQSGSGKSTLLKLLLRFYEKYKGNIYIDNTEIRNIKVSSIYKLMSIIHQDVFIFDDTMENNISLYGKYNKAKLEDVIEKSGLKVLVDSLEKGVNSQVGEDGCNLSGGEKQRIAIARALVKETPILILDEATSSLDNETAYNIEKSIMSLNDLTCLVVTHKLNEGILSKYDSIIVLRNGEVVEVGKFHELMENKEYFYNLYKVKEKTEDIQVCFSAD